MMVMGMLTANVLGLPFLLGTEERWFMLITIQGIPVLVMCAFLPFCPDSPRRLFLTVGNKEGAVRALVWLRGTTDVHVEIDQMNREQTMMKEDSGKDDHKPVTLMGIFRDRYLRNIFWMCAVPMFAKQFSGYMCIFYYSTSIFNGVGLDHLYSGIATCGVWATYLVFSLVSMALVDRAGRKTLLLISHTGMIIGMSLFTVFMVLSGRYQLDWAKFGCAGSLFFYIASYAIASGSIPFFLPNEMFPQNARTAAQTWNGVLCSGLGLITSMLFPIVVFLLEEYTFLIFVASMALATVYLIWKLPETKGKSIDEIQTLLRRRLR
ncbi:putative Solute carrier family 2, facilitated glucose transporter member 3 [Hypsibius exemplaris]|uniref:Solute carrier family 2, facilitated glucose transporter member 3 n=1 Tax=Hypsibius exemplaris TaxID=2072580 RepID=A0A1W0WT30_HYPEX|nr:putative Solute carrier family 2, facilitated glucose transporter member 3 [Hypsibius exemplaris]